MRRETTHAMIAALLLVGGCDRFTVDEAPPPVAPIAPATVTVRTQAGEGLTLFVDGHPTGALADGQQLQLDPGPHAFEARRDNEIVARVEQTLTAGQPVVIHLDPPTPAAAAAPPAADPAAPSNAVAAGPVRGRVTHGDPTVETDGGVSATVIVRVLRRHLRAMQRCYELLLATEPAAAGTVRARVTLQPSGRVQSVAAADPVDDGLLRCADQTLGRATFPSGDASTVFVVPITFAALGGAAVGGAGDASLPATPGRSRVVDAMNRVEPAIRACGGPGLATVRFTFESDGAVREAQVRGGSWTTAQRSCIERAASAARVPQFRDASFTFSYPFRL